MKYSCFAIFILALVAIETNFFVVAVFAGEESSNLTANFLFKIPVYIEMKNYLPSLDEGIFSLELPKNISNTSVFLLTDEFNSALPYWLEEACGEEEERILWFRLNLTNRSEQIRLSLYYGNTTPIVCSLCNKGDLVFDFFDDFSSNRSLFEKWIPEQYSGSTGYAKIVDSLLEIYSGHSGTGSETPADGFRVTTKLNFTFPLFSKTCVKIKNWGGYGSAGYYRTAGFGIGGGTIPYGYLGQPIDWGRENFIVGISISERGIELVSKNENCTKILNCAEFASAYNPQSFTKYSFFVNNSMIELNISTNSFVIDDSQCIPNSSDSFGYDVYHWGWAYQNENWNAILVKWVFVTRNYIPSLFYRYIIGELGPNSDFFDRINSSLFLTDTNWKNILSLAFLPSPVIVSPTNTSEVDYFIKTYNPSKIYLLGNTSGFEGHKISYEDIPALFPNQTPICVKTFDQAMHAALISSLLNSPLVFDSNENCLDLSNNTTEEIDELYLKLAREHNKNINYLVVSKPSAYSALIAARKHGFLLVTNETNPAKVKQQIASTVEKLNSYGFYINSTSYLLDGAYILLIGIPSFTLEDPVEKQKLLGLLEVSDQLDGNTFESDLPYADLNNDTYLDVAVGRLPDNETLTSLMIARNYLPENKKALVASEYLHQSFPVILLYLGGGMLQGRNIAETLELQGFNVTRLVEHRSNPVIFLKSLMPSEASSFISQAKKLSETIGKIAGSTLASAVFNSLVALKSMQYAEQALEIYYEYDWSRVSPRWQEALEYLKSLNSTESLSLDAAINLVYKFLWPNPWPTLNKTNLVYHLASSSLLYYGGIGNGSVWILPNNVEASSDIMDWDFWRQLFENYQYNGSSNFTASDTPLASIKLVWDDSDLAAKGSIKDKFLERASSAFVGATAVSYAPFSSEISSRFFSKSYTVGQALIKAINDFRDDWFTWDPLDATKPSIKAKALREFMLWGDPSLEKDPIIELKDHEINTTCNNDLCNLTLTIPISYAVSNGTISIDANEYLLELGRPIIPLKTFEYYLPFSADVLNTSLSMEKETYENITLPKLFLLSHSLTNITLNETFSDLYPNETKILINKTIDGRTRIKLIVPLIFYNESGKEAMVVEQIKFSMLYKSPLELAVETRNIRLNETESIRIKIWSSVTDNATLYLTIENSTCRQEYSYNLSLTPGIISLNYNFSFSVPGNYTARALLVKHDPLAVGPRESTFMVSENETELDSDFNSTAKIVCEEKIKITEIMYDPKGSDEGREWIEIFNAGNCSLNLSSFKLYESETNHKLKLFKGSWILQPGEYAIIARNGTKFLQEYNNISCIIFESSFSLKNSGEEIAIKNSSLAVLDSIDYTPYAQAGLARDNGKSLELKSNGWVESYVDGGTPGKPNDDEPPKVSKPITGEAILTSTPTSSNKTSTQNTTKETRETKENKTSVEEKPKVTEKESTKVTSKQTEEPANKTTIQQPTGYFSLPENVSVTLGVISSLAGIAYMLFRFFKNT